MSQAVYHIGDTREVTATLDDDSVDLVLTSPPFLALRSYLPDGHEHKHHEIGSEATPAEFVDVLLELAAEWRRVLAPHGSIAIELGDTYSGTHAGGDAGGMTRGARPNAERHIRPQRETSEGWPLAKSLALVPELFRIGLAYGINPLTGTESPAGRWRVRNVVRWHRPNPPVGALGDKYRPATTDMVIACPSDRRWFDLDAVRDGDRTSARAESPHPKSSEFRSQGVNGLGADTTYHARGGAPPLDTWTIPTHPFKGAHYATWPPELCRIPIDSMCPRQVCETCGEPRRRITSDPTYTNGDGTEVEPHVWPSGIDTTGAHANKKDGGITRTTATLGWSGCDCPDPTYRPGMVLDPFAGSGTTLAVATGHSRDAIGIDLDPRNAQLAEQRVGMFLTVNDPVSRTGSRSP